MEKNEKKASSMKVMEERDIQKVAASPKVAKVFGQIGIYLFLGLLSKIADKPLALLFEKHFQPKPYSRAIGAAVGAVCGFVLTVAILCPLTGLLPMVGSVAPLLDEEIAQNPIVIDLQQTAYDALVLEIPIKILCREDCRGLCPSCGKNLNDGDCGCNN